MVEVFWKVRGHESRTMETNSWTILDFLGMFFISWTACHIEYESQIVMYKYVVEKILEPFLIFNSHWILTGAKAS